MAKELLELRTAKEADTIKIDGESYALADPDSFDFVQSAEIRQIGKTIERIAAKQELTEEEAREADRALERAIEIIAPGIPANVAAKLKPGQKSKLIDVFFRRVAERRGVPLPSSPTPPDSSASTAAASASG